MIRAYSQGFHQLIVSKIQTRQVAAHVRHAFIIPSRHVVLQAQLPEVIFSPTLSLQRSDAFIVLEDTSSSRFHVWTAFPDHDQLRRECAPELVSKPNAITSIHPRKWRREHER